MPISEAARHDLYNGLSDLLGPDRADTLMAYLPEFDPKDVATKADIARLDSNIVDVILEIKELRAEMTAGFVGVSQRFDHMFLTLVGGLFVVVAAMAGVVFTTL